MTAPEPLPVGAVSSGRPLSDVAAALMEDALPALDDVLGFIRRRHRLGSDEAEDFAGQARLKLIENDCAVLRAYQSRASLRSYLGVVLQRLFIDFRRQRWGTWRPSAEARRLGAPGLLLDRLLFRDGMSLDEAIESAAARGAWSPAVLRELAGRLPWHARRRIDGEDALPEIAVSAAGVEAPLLDRERAVRVGEVRSALRAVLQRLPAEDALLLRLLFDEGMTVARVSGLLGLDAKPLYRRIERLLRQLREGLEASGVAAVEVTELVDADAFSGP